MHCCYSVARGESVPCALKSSPETKDDSLNWNSLCFRVHVSGGVILGWIQVPFWCKGEMPEPCGDPELYTLSGIPYIKNWHSLLIQVCDKNALAYEQYPYQICKWYRHLSSISSFLRWFEHETSVDGNLVSTVQALCLAFLVFSTILQWYFLGKMFWTRPLSVCKVSGILLSSYLSSIQELENILGSTWIPH